MKSLKLKNLITSILIVAIINLLSMVTIHAASDMDVALTTPGTKYIGQQFTLDARINTDSKLIDTISIRNLVFENAKLQSLSTNIFSVFASQTTLINTSGIGFSRVDIGKIPLTANYSNTSHIPFTRFSYLPINTGAGATGTAQFIFNFDATPSTSGTFLSGVKNLDTVTGLTINLAEDNTPPVVSNCTPTSGATGVPVNTDISCDVTDPETGIYINSTSMSVNSITYLSTGPTTFSYTPISNGYRITVNPVNNLPYYTNIPVAVTTQDNAYDNGPILARNTTVLPSFTFRTEDDNDAPQVYNQSPSVSSINIATSSNVVFNLRDIANPGGYGGTGIDLSTLSITLSASGWGPFTYTQSGPQTFNAVAITSPFDYTIAINPSIDFPENTTVNVSITVSDFDSLVPAPNTLNTSYSFLTLDSVAPVCNFISPQRGATDILVNAVIKIECTDAGVGVNVNSIIIVVNGIAYRSSGPNQFSNTGTLQAMTFTVDPTADFQANYALEVVLTGADLSGNITPMLSYGLATGVVVNPCSNSNPLCNQISGGVSQGGNSTNPQNLVNISLVEKQVIVEIPFRTTTNELQNIQIQKINEVDIESIIKTITIDGEIITFEGIAQQYANVSLLIESNPLLLTTIADANGNWKIETQNIFSAGTHNVFGIARNEKTGEITQKKLFAYLDIQKSAMVSEINWLWIIILFIVSVLISYYTGRHYKKKERLTNTI